MTISAIVAVAKNDVIGKDNQIPWHLRDDLKFFKRTTLNHHIIMGRKSFESIGRPLPKRTNVIITRDPFYLASGCLIVHSLQEALDLARDNGEEEAFIIGGAQIYELAMPLLHKLYYTEVNALPEGDVHFPDLDLNQWTLTRERKREADMDNDYDFVFKEYEKSKEG